MREKVRIRNQEKMRIVTGVEATIFLELKQFLNTLPLISRLKAAFLIIIGRF